MPASEESKRHDFTAHLTRFCRVLRGYGETVEDADEIRPALERAFASGKPAVINVIVEPTAAGVSRSWGGSNM
ncbi:MAG: hypothetical protein IIC85_00430 [Chloroflexi bacterium]|nr:hypothetical protein [Chloroflexota bacterium]